MTKLTSLDLDCAGANSLRSQRVDQKAILRKHHRLARLNEGMSSQLQNVIAAVTQGNPVLRHSILGADSSLQFEAIGIRIAADIGYCLLHGQSSRLRHTQRVFIGSQFNDLAFFQTEFASDFGNRFASLVRRNGTYICRTQWNSHEEP